MPPKQPKHFPELPTTPGAPSLDPSSRIHAETELPSHAYVEVEPRTRIVEEGGSADFGYLIVSGTLLAFAGSKCVGTLRAGQAFGAVLSGRSEDDREPVRTQSRERSAARSSIFFH